MKKIAILLAALIAMPTTIFAETNNKHAEWKFIKQSSNNATGADFVQSGRYHASVGDKAWIRFESKHDSAKSGLTKKSEPISHNTQAGDSWVFEMPVKNLDKGAIVDVWIPLHAHPSKVSHRFVAEYRDGKQWLPLVPTEADGCNYHSSKTSQTAHIWQSFSLNKKIKRGVVAFRLRQIEPTLDASYIVGGNRFAQMTIFPKVELRDTTRILFVGNSYTYYNNLPFIFKQIAMMEGHYIDCRMTTKGGYTMKKHLTFEPTRLAVEAGGYDYAFLQDQSYERIFSGTEDDYGSLQGMTDLVAYVRAHSPKTNIVISLTWGRKHGDNHLRKQDKPLVKKYPSFFTDFDAMQARLNEVVDIEAKCVDAMIAKQGPAWQIVRRERPDIELFNKDGSHPSYTGSYLAAAVSYLTIFKQPFGDNPWDGNLDAETAKYLRSVAERVVLKGEKIESLR